MEHPRKLIFGKYKPQKKDAGKNKTIYSMVCLQRSELEIPALGKKKKSATDISWNIEIFIDLNLIV